MAPKISNPSPRLQLFKNSSADLIAGVTVGLVALPLAMAFAIASGVPPQAGIYCAIVTGFLISALGGSTHANRRPDRRVRRRRSRHHFALRHRRPLHLHHDGRRSARHHGHHRLGALVKYFPRPVDRRLHQRHRHPHRQHADSRFLWPAHGTRPRRFLSSHGRDRAELSHY